MRGHRPIAKAELRSHDHEPLAVLVSARAQAELREKDKVNT
jgi:hypothetical protein